MKTLTIFYDPDCGLCAKFRGWLEVQPKRVDVRFLAYQCQEAKALFPGLDEIGADKDVVVLADDGRWWQGCAAWLTCLWATLPYHAWSYRLASPALQPFVKKAVHLLSKNRLTLSRLMKLESDGELRTAIQSLPDVPCTDRACTLS